MRSRLYPGSHKLGNLEAEKKESYREKDGKPGNKIKYSTNEAHRM